MIVKLDAQQAIGYLIAAGGNPALAASRAAKELGDTNITEALFLATIAADPTSLDNLSSSIKLLASLQALDAFRITHMSYKEKLAALSPKDTAKAYTDLLAQMVVLGSGASASQADPFEAVMRSLPPEAAEAVAFFAKQTRDKKVIEALSIASDAAPPHSLSPDSPQTTIIEAATPNGPVTDQHDR